MKENERDICDFCSSPDVAWRYPAKSFDILIRGWEIGVTSDGDWAACDECARLIDAGKKEELMERGIQTFPNPLTPKSLVKSFIRDIHQGFWAQKFGKKKPADSIGDIPTA